MKTIIGKAVKVVSISKERCFFVLGARIFFSCACSKFFILFVVIFWVQNYNKSCTPTIGFEDYFCELKTVKDFLIVEHAL